jgi:hypothetical protein
MFGWSGQQGYSSGNVEFDVKEKLSFEMSQLFFRQRLQLRHCDDLTYYPTFCDAFLYPFLLFVFSSFSFLLYPSVYCAVFLSFLLSSIFFVLSSKN